MIQLDIKVDARDARVFLRSAQTGVAKATARALNKTMTPVRAEAARRLQEQRNLPISQIKKAMRVVRATPQYLASTLVVSGRPISIRHFANHGKRGVTVKIERSGKRTLLRRGSIKAFVNPKWRPGVFIRKGKSRLPIEAWPPVPGLPRVLVQDRIMAALRSVVVDVFPKRMREELHYELNVAKRRG